MPDGTSSTLTRYGVNSDARSEVNVCVFYCQESQHPGHAGPFYVVEDVNSVQVEDYVVEGVEDGVEISVGVDSVNIMEEVSIA